MAGCHRRAPITNQLVVRERYLRDMEMEDLRGQVQLLQEHLVLMEVLGHDEPCHVSEHDALSVEEDEINPSYHAPNQALSDEEALPQSRHPQRNVGFQWDINLKVDILEFEGHIKSDEFIDWINSIKWIFDYKEVPNDCKVKIVAIKLKKHASIWWEQQKIWQAYGGKPKIRLWEKMKDLKKFLSKNYLQETFLKLHFSQEHRLVEEYMEEFDHLMMRHGISEPEEQTIAWVGLGGRFVMLFNFNHTTLIMMFSSSQL